MIQLEQKNNVKLFATKKTVDWLVNNTEVSVFDPVSFEGYQRQINEGHCQKIVEFLCVDFFLPTAIICATSKKFEPESTLRIVDGQHRVYAFRMLKRDHRERYDEIKDKEIPVIVMDGVDEKVEIDTFITINKTSKKVDTSLAIVLKNKLNKYAASEDLSMPRAEYLAVEVALKLYSNPNCELWYDKILLEGTTKNTPQFITLNAFVKSTRTLINNMVKKKLLVLDWQTKEDIDGYIAICQEAIMSIWNSVAVRWSDLFNSNFENRRIIQGPIGYSSINRLVNMLLAKYNYISLDEFKLMIESNIRRISMDEKCWLPGGYFSGFSSESGYSIIANELLKSIK
ncbi:MAG: DGQHR domain-containing protein [Clostridiales bacterium]|nr:DGQHR domain-containing protein [Clostridiales bacterium]